jgi:hypothetical protein
VPAHVTEHEAHQVVRVGVVGIELDGPLQRRQGVVVQPAIVEHLPDVEMHERAVRVELARANEPLLGFLEIAAGLLGQAELDDRAEVVRVVAEQLRELGHRLGLLPEQRVGPSQLPAGLAVGGMAAQSLLQLGDAAVVVAGIEVGDLEVALRDLHLLVELERAHERTHRFLVQALVVVEHPEVVVRPRVGRIDPARERSQNLAIAFGGEGRDHAYATRVARRIACSDATSGRRRKKPRRRSPESIMKNSLSTQKT